MRSDIFKMHTNFLRIHKHRQCERTSYIYQGTVNQRFSLVENAGFSHMLMYFIKKPVILLVKLKASKNIFAASGLQDESMRFMINYASVFDRRQQAITCSHHI